jgi:fatty-acid peroxygenase
VAERSRDLVALFDRAGASLAGNFTARRARRRMEAWAREVIERIRAGRLCPGEGAAAGVIAWHRSSGRLLAPEVAAVELLNVLRPTVAVSVYIALAAHALHEFPWARVELEKGDGEAAERFVQEVRRYYPFFPALFARVRRAFLWSGHRVRVGARAVLDIPGTNRDPRTWSEPDRFDPERFRDGTSAFGFGFVPQGGGDAASGHRCPGESIAVSLTIAALEWLVRRMRYEVPPQDLSIDRSRMPALPRSRFAMSRIETAGP